MAISMADDSKAATDLWVVRGDDDEEGEHGEGRGRGAGEGREELRGVGG